MSTRKCITCNGTGNLWGTPKLSVEGGLNDQQGPQSDYSDRGYGLGVLCWRCLGKGSVPADRQDEGEVNG